MKVCLYPDNVKFIRDQMPEPVNSDEIKYNLRKKHNVSDVSSKERFILGVGAVSLAIWGAMFALLTIRFIWLTGIRIISVVDVISLFFLMLFIAFFSLLSIVGSRQAFFLFAHRIDKVEHDWKRLLQKGEVIDKVSIVEKHTKSPLTHTIIYRVQVPSGKIVEGTYYVRYLFAHQINHLCVLYVDDNLYTLI